MQRQYAASQYIKYLYNGWEILNLDESIINFTDQRKMGWISLGEKNYIKQKPRLSQISLIAAISSKGRFFYSVNSGINNSQTIYHFILKLVTILTSQNSNWRANTIILLDNSQTHRSHMMIQRLEKLKLPIFFLSPYHFLLASVERFVSYVKVFNLNREIINYTSKYHILTWFIFYRVHLQEFLKSVG